MNRRRSKGGCFQYLTVLVLPLVFWLGYRQLRVYFEQPQAILVLGGATEREKFAAEFAREHPGIPIWVSSGSPRAYSQHLFAKSGISQSRLHLDYRAVDTVTNFTTLVDKLKGRGIKNVYLITSDDHMRRARIIADVVLGSRGIDFEPISVPSGRSPEPIQKVVRDGARALLWVTTGYTGATLVRSKGEN